MTEVEYGPMTARRRLAQRLADHRARLTLSGTDVVDPLNWSQSRLSRIESGKHPIQVQDTFVLATVYELSADEREALTALARSNLEAGWWEPYRTELGKAHSRFIGMEAESTTERTFASSMVPGVMQTSDYARGVIQNGPAELTPDQIDRRVEARTVRSDVLTRTDTPMRLYAIMDESVLRRPVGSPTVMREQMQHLLELAELPRITLQVLPFAAGAHPSMEGSFVILDFTPPVDPAVYIESPGGETWVEDHEQTGRFQVAFTRLTQMALSPADTIRLIADTASQN